MGIKKYRSEPTKVTNVALRPLSGIGLCAGIGWLDLAIKFAWEYHGYDYRTLAFCERDAYAAAVLLARMEDKSLEQAAICDSIEDLDDRFRGVDCLVAGFPCQDISCAGRGDGIIHGKRSSLFFTILATAVRLGVKWLFLENVGALTVRGLDTVLGALAEAGFDAEWLCLQAAQVGASHKRERWFCVAHRRCDKFGYWQQRQQSVNGKDRPLPRHELAGSGADVEHARGPQRTETNGRQEHTECKPATSSGRLADTSGAGLSQRRSERRNDGGERATAERDCLPIFAPGPSDPRWFDILREYPWLSPAVSKEDAQCLFRRVADGSLAGMDEPRADRLRCVGNAVVCIQAAVAFAKVLGRMNP